MARLRLSEEDGFTLIELVIVVMILAILIAIAIPTFLGVRDRADDTAAKSSSVLALRSALGIGAGEMFEEVTTAELNAAEPSLTFVDEDSPSTSFTVVSQFVPDAGAGNSIFVAAVHSTSGTCFMLRHVAGGTDFATAEVPSCKAEDHGLMAFGPSW